LPPQEPPPTTDLERQADFSNSLSEITLRVDHAVVARDTVEVAERAGGDQREDGGNAPEDAEQLRVRESRQGWESRRAGPKQRAADELQPVGDRQREADRLEKRFLSLKPFDKRCTLTVRYRIARPAMERTPAGVKLFKLAQSIAQENLNVELGEAGSGGGSDGNFTAAVGCPTLDGIGVVGENAHSPKESILIDRIADRTALLAHLVARLGAA
jgi:acetylornithine deacetylase/succinyl-diaminopimelate desuccinylase-like protein